MKKKELKELMDFLKIRITDSESVRMKKEAIHKFLEKEHKPNNGDFKNWDSILGNIFIELTLRGIFKEVNFLSLKKERIKNYMLYIENQAINANEYERIPLREKWKACKRWLNSIEVTQNYKLEPPIELLQD